MREKEKTEVCAREHIFYTLWSQKERIYDSDNVCEIKMKVLMNNFFFFFNYLIRPLSCTYRLNWTRIKNKIKITITQECMCSVQQLNHYKLVPGVQCSMHTLQFQCKIYSLQFQCGIYNLQNQFKIYSLHFQCNILSL